jgi:site-specific DNA recombinase
MSRAAQEGRFTGGIVPFGYRVEGAKEKAHLVPDEEPFWGETSAAELVRQIYAWLCSGKSCYWIADHLNDLSVPTAYVKDGRLLKDSRGRRTKATQGKWRPGRIRSLVVNPVYKGELAYGRRSKRQREVIVAPVASLVPADVWETAQKALTANRILRRRAKYINVLRSVVVCGTCGLNYSAAAGRGDVVWLRCNGQITHRGKIQGRCPSKSIKLGDLRPIVLADIEGFLRDPGPILDELAAAQVETAAAMGEAERLALEAAIASAPKQRKLILERLRLGKITEAECDEQLDEIARSEEQQRRRLAELTPVERDDEPDLDLLTEIRQLLDAGLDDVRWQEIVHHLVRRIVVHTEYVGGKKRARIVVDYRFPGVAATSTGKGSWRRRA